MGEESCKCKRCEQIKPYIFKKIAKSGNYLYVDNHGRLWKGKVCADCQAEIRRTRTKQASI